MIFPPGQFAPAQHPYNSLRSVLEASRKGAFCPDTARRVWTTKLTMLALTATRLRYRCKTISTTRNESHGDCRTLEQRRPNAGIFTTRRKTAVWIPRAQFYGGMGSGDFQTVSEAPENPCLTGTEVRWFGVPRALSAHRRARRKA